MQWKGLFDSCIIMRKLLSGMMWCDLWAVPAVHTAAVHMVTSVLSLQKHVRNYAI